MHVAMISDLELSGGAGIAATHLANGLLGYGVNVSRIAAFCDEGIPVGWNRYQLRNPPQSILDRVLARFAHHGILPEFHQQRVLAKDRSLLEKWLKENHPDVINLHNIHYAGWDADFVDLLCDHAPVVWTLHDMWSFTGRCAYNMDCEKYLQGCDDRCPTPGEYPSLPPDQISEAWKKKRRLLKTRQNIIGVSPSTWLRNKAKGSFWKSVDIQVIPYGIDLASYKPVDTEEARQYFGLDSGAWTILVSGDSASEGRKGERAIVKILEELTQVVQSDLIQVVLIGRWPEPFEIATQVSMHNIGFISEKERLCMALSCADVLLFTSKADNLPNLLIKSMACGTPVAAFSVGGIPEIIEHGKTGILVDTGDIQAMVSALNSFINGDYPGISRHACRENAETKFDSQLQASRYLKLFEEIIQPEKLNQIEFS